MTKYADRDQSEKPASEHCPHCGYGGWYGSRWHNPDRYSQHIHCDCGKPCRACEVGDGFHRSGPERIWPPAAAAAYDQPVPYVPTERDAARADLLGSFVDQSKRLAKAERALADERVARIGDDSIRSMELKDALKRAEAAEAKVAQAWDDGYAMASDDFTHSDYCGLTCQCEGIHGQSNPYRATTPDPETEPCPHTCSCTSDMECPHDCPCDGA